MITAPVSRPELAKAIVIGTGIAGILIARFLPSELRLWKDILDAIGATGIGIGGVQVVQAPKHGGP